MDTKSRRGNSGAYKEPQFIIEKEGSAYFKDKRLALVCKPSKASDNPKYPGYPWKFEYMGKIEWFKRFIALMLVNKAYIRFVGFDVEEFNMLGGSPLNIKGVERISTKPFKGKLN